MFYNNGQGFDLPCPLDINLDNQSASMDNSINVAGVFSIIVPFPFIGPIKIPFGINATILSNSKNSIKKSIEDFDGDGYPDYVEHMNDCIFLLEGQNWEI